MRVNDTLYYTLKDHLDSTTGMTDASGSLISQQSYYPFGQTRFTSGTLYTDKLYTGQRDITGLGIYHYNARFYSPYINDKGLGDNLQVLCRLLILKRQVRNHPIPCTI
jgi:hypothetical protein